MRRLSILHEAPLNLIFTLIKNSLREKHCLIILPNSSLDNWSIYDGLYVFTQVFTHKNKKSKAIFMRKIAKLFNGGNHCKFIQKHRIFILQYEFLFGRNN